MKTIIIAIVMAIAGFALAFLIITSGSSSPVSESSSAVQQYTCGMHPEIVSDEPGYCPLCSMKLTPKKDGSISSAGGILIDPTTSQNMGIVTSEAYFHSLTRKVKSFGEVTYSEPNIYTVNLKVEGWVEKLFADETGLEISKGQPLFEIYSPKLIAAQEEYLNAKRQVTNNSSGSAKNILTAAKKRLLNWDISEDQIENLDESSDIKRTIIIRSPSDGTIIDKNITNGDFLKPGKELYKIADLSTVWVKAFIYEQDVPYLSHGQPAKISIPSMPGQDFISKIDYISPFLNNKKQIEIRLELDNSNNLLRPKMYAEVSIESSLEGERLVIPYSAVIHSGTKKIIYVTENKNSFIPKEISTGVIGDNDLIEVISGLDEGDLVVTSGQFMLDSESRLNEALTDGADVGHDHGAEAETKSEPDEFDPDELVATGGHDIYTCPMPVHFDQLQYGEGDCSECGMKLVPLGETNNKKVYVCPMSECETVRDNKKEQCPVCNMNLVRYQTEDLEEADAE
ncbi:MAG: efflux RND transporter periplasmic adaptor subunit [candidate division Zixibacteria bacterium]|nr:efflux RND transporter periplasmic adaptor subunit [candidate division Zixibacteria bacterium]